MGSALPASQFRGKHALVIGGGIAGLLAAHILLDHFEQVTLLERDHYPEQPEFRSGVPQGHHTHVFLVRGQVILEKLFPGFQKKLLAQGALESDFLADYQYDYGYGPSPRFPSQLRGVTCSRLLIEWQIRQEVTQAARLSVREGYEVLGLSGDQQARVITGVRVRRRDALRATGQTAAKLEESELIPADLVVDASGRSSQASRWLKELGYDEPAETVINSFLGYATRTYAVPEKFAQNWNGMLVQTPAGEVTRGGVIWPVEGQRWMVVLGGAGRDYPPTDEEGYLAFAKSLPEPAFYEAIKDAQPLSPIYGYRRTENYLRHFERLRSQPDGFIAIGDAVCAFNPVYGQGMTAAAQGAIVLDESLRRHSKQTLQGFARVFQRRLARANATVWQLATSADYRVPQTEGPRQPLLARWTSSYTERITPLLAKDPQIMKTFAEVLHFMKPGTALFHPTIAFKVLRQPRPGK